jgi:hypothetical protein
VIFAGFVVEVVAFAVAVICLIAVVIDVWGHWRNRDF